MIKIFLTALYLYFRSKNSSTFTLAPYKLSTNDYFGIIFFIASFTNSYSFVYTLIPLRNLFMFYFQKLNPYFEKESIKSELLRNIIAQIFTILIISTLIVYEQYTNNVTKIYNKQSNIIVIIEILLIIQSIFCIIIGTLRSNKKFVLSKLFLCLVLGYSEELQWRIYFQKKTNVEFQAIVWGLNHYVSGEGIRNKFLYFIISTIYGYMVGITNNIFIKFVSHITIEWFVIDNLIK